MAKKHIRLSVRTRNSEVITKVNNGATSAELSEEYGVTWETIRDSIRDKHYQVLSRPHNESRYQAFLAQVKRNNATAAAVTKTTDLNTSVVENERPEKHCPNATATPVTITDKETIYLVETGYLLHTDFNELLSMDNGNAVFMIPRFCINELKRMAKKPSCDSVKDLADTVLWKMFDSNIWQKRFIPFEPIEQGMIAKTPDTKDYKSRSFGIAEAALELYIDSNCRIHVLTNAMEIQHLIYRIVKEEDLASEILVTRVYNN